jgi:hypothetical protein
MIDVAAPVRRHPLTALFVLAFGITWLGAIPFALGVFPVPMFPFGPLVAALIVASVSGGRRAIKDLLLRMLQWRVAPVWYAYAIFIPLGVALSAAYLNVVMFGAPDPTGPILAALPSAIPGFALMMLNPMQGTMGEEPGWRGIAMPRMLTTLSPFTTSLFLGVLVAAWHLPLFLTGMYANLLVHVAFLIITTVLYTLLHFGTRGSVLLAMVFHTGWNLAPEVLLYSAFTGSDWDRALVLYLMGGVVVALVAAPFLWRRPRTIDDPVRAAAQCGSVG